MHHNCRAKPCGDGGEIAIEGQERGFGANGHAGDQAVDQATRRDPLCSAGSVDTYGAVEVGGCVERDQKASPE